jgi:transcriptional regulator CtsR
VREMVEEKQLVERLAPRIEERIRYKIVRSIIDALEEQFYPPEEMFREEFVKSVEEAEKRVKEGKTKTFKNANELNAFLESLKTEE